MNERIANPIYSKIVEEALKTSNMPSSQSYIENFPDMTIEEKTKELLTPRVLAHKEGDVFSVYLRFAEDEFPLVDAAYYPHLAAKIFFEAAKTTLKDYYGFNESDLEEYGRREAVNMLITMLKSTYRRISLTLEHIVTETIINWQHREQETLAQVLLPEGISLSNVSQSKRLSDLNRSYGKNIKALWNDIDEKRSDLKKQQLAKEYPAIFKHWKFLQNLSKNNDNWREYSKAGIFSDTPDDLLNLLFDTEPAKLSHIAVEHTARRVGLINILSKNQAFLEKWKQGINVSGYDSHHLMDLKTEGDRLIKNSQSDEIKETSDQKA